MIHFLRLVHILGGVFWVGSAVFMAAFLAPTVRAIGPAGGQVMQQLAQVRKLPIYMMSAMALTLLSGITLYWRASGGFTNTWPSSGAGITYGIGGVLALLGATIGVTVSMPSARRLGVIAATAAKSGGPPSSDQMAEIQRLQGRMTTASQYVAVLLMLATAAMAVARYVA
jgi:hypothetical protein